jgi:hypothetical protein
VAVDYELSLPMNRTVDDIGFFDSIMLARSYRLILDLSGASPELNIQNFNGSEMSSRGLATMGVKFLVTTAKSYDLRSEGEVLGINIYRIPSPAPRAEFFDADQIQYTSTNKIHVELRDPKIDLHSVLLLPRDLRPIEGWLSTKSAESPAVQYSRPDSDHIECTVITGRNGYLRIIESWDPGWSATVDGYRYRSFLRWMRCWRCPSRRGGT